MGRTDAEVLKLKLQYFGHLSKELTHWKRLMMGRIDSRRRRGQQRMRRLGGITDSMDMSLSKPWEMVTDRKAGQIRLSTIFTTQG